MPRSSRHRSHRSRKHSRDRSYSDGEEISRETRTREEELAASPGNRVSRDPEPEKRRPSHEHAGKDLVRTSNGDVSGEHGKKRKERMEEVVANWWNGDDENVRKKSKAEECGPVELDKSSKSKLLAADSKGRSSRRHEGSNERDEDYGGKNDSVKWKPEKDLSRRESSGQHTDGKERDRIERDCNKNREAQDSSHDKSDDLQSRKHAPKGGSNAGEPGKFNERQALDVLHSPETDKELEKHTRRRDHSEDKDKWLDTDDHSKNRNYKDERHEDAKDRGNYRDQKHHDDKYRDERSSKDRSSNKSDKGRFRDENKPPKSHEKTKLQASDRDGTSYVDDHDNNPKYNRGRKRYSDEKGDYSDLKSRSAKEQRKVVEKSTSSTSRTGSHNDKATPEYQHPEKSDSSPRNNWLKNSTSCSTYASKDCNRYISKLAESAQRESTAEKGRSPSANSGRRFSERSPSKCDRTARQRLDIEVGQRSNSSKDGAREELALEKPILDDTSQTDICARESTPVGSSSINRSGSDCSHNHLSTPPVRLGMDSPSALGPYQDDNRAQSSDRKYYSHYKQIGDRGSGRGHGNAWKGTPTRASPVTNGFIPLQHGPPPDGFHPAMSQFSTPPLFGVRPSIDLAHGGASYQMHDVAERFSGHGRPFGWHNPVDQLCHPRMQMWDGSNGMFNNWTHIYARPEWDENYQLRNRWEIGSEMWKGKISDNMDIPVSKNEQESLTHSLNDELAQSRYLPTESIEAKRSSGTPSARSAVESPQKAVIKKTPRSSDVTNHGATYLSRVDISPELAGSELYKKCTALLGKLDVNNSCSLTTYRCFQTNKHDSMVKMKSTSSILNSFFPTAKDDVFKRAMSLCKKQNERTNRKDPVSAAPKEKKKESSEASDNDIVDAGADCTSLEKIHLSNADSASDMEVGDSDCPGNVKDQKSDFISDDVIFSNGPQACEALMEECRVNLSQIHNSPENTH